jgi:hypothetical protein
MSQLQSPERYRFRETLGKTNLATTRLASDAESGRACVVKTLKFADIEDEKILELFHREARVLANLDHPYIPKFIGVFEEGTGEERTLNLVQEYVAGKNLAQAIEGGMRFVERDVIEIAIRLCRILEYLHAFSPPIIHRDIKPNNIILGEADEPYLIDFGGVRDRMMQDRSPHGGGFTIVGSYGYMPYEQFEGRAVPPSDIYSLGATLVYLLSHKEPSDFDRDGLRLKIRGEVNVSFAFLRVLEKMIDPDWRRRYQSAEDARRDMEKILAAGEAVETKRWIAAAVLSAAVLFGAYFVSTGRTGETEALPKREVAAETVKPAALSGTTAGSVSVVGLPVVRGQVLFDGRPITEVTRVAPNFWFRNEDTGRAQDGAARYRDGAFEIYALPPGRYGMNVRLDARPDNPFLYPGDFESWTSFTVEAGQPSVVDVNVYEVMHLLSPTDNSARIPGGSECGARPVHGKSMTIAWKPAGGEGVFYDYSITRVECPYKSSSSVLSGTTAETSVNVELPRTGRDEFYLLNLSARKDGRRIGGLLTHGSNYLAWDYRFQVE